MLDIHNLLRNPKYHQFWTTQKGADHLHVQKRLADNRLGMISATFFGLGILVAAYASLVAPTNKTEKAQSKEAEVSRVDKPKAQLPAKPGQMGGTEK